MDEQQLQEIEASYAQVPCQRCGHIVEGVTNQVNALIAEVRRLQQAEQEAHAEVNALRAQTRLLTHKVITCGVAASHPDPHLTRKEPYAGRWNSPQAEAVRQVRTQRDAALAEIVQRQADLLLTAQAHCEILDKYEADLAQARQERDAEAESCRRMQDRLQRLIDGSNEQSHAGDADTCAPRRRACFAP